MEWVAKKKKKKVKRKEKKTALLPISSECKYIVTVHSYYLFCFLYLCACVTGWDSVTLLQNCGSLTCHQMEMLLRRKNPVFISIHCSLSLPPSPLPRQQTHTTSNTSTQCSEAPPLSGLYWSFQQLVFHSVYLALPHHFTAKYITNIS